MLPTLWALTLASQGRPSITVSAIFIAGSFVMRSAGVVLNDLADRHLDRQVARTQSRPLACGAIGVPTACAILGLLVATAAVLLSFLNWRTQILGPIALLLAALYPFSKRYVDLPQAMLGIAFGWGTIMAWTAVRNQVELTAWLLFAATVCWALTYDTIYALQDRDDDIRVGIKSGALLFGRHVWLAVGCFGACTVGLLALAGWLAGLKLFFYICMLGVGGFFGWQAWRLRRLVPPTLALTMFKQHIWAGWVIWGGILAGFVPFP
jgi:4-hydroxybenzoate polyprenyltransferase